MIDDLGGMVVMLAGAIFASTHLPHLSLEYLLSASILDATRLSHCGRPTGE